MEEKRKEPRTNGALLAEMKELNQNFQYLREILWVFFLEKWFFELSFEQQQRLSVVRSRVSEKWISYLENLAR